jgi:hypothetical protein
MWIVFAFRGAATTLFNGDERPKGEAESRVIILAAEPARKTFSAFAILQDSVLR